NSIGYLGSVAYIKIGLSIVLFYTFPIITLILSAAIRVERPTPAKVLCLLAAFGGVLLASYRNIGDAFDWRGVALIMVGAVGFAVAIVFGNRGMRGASPLTMNFWMNVWMALVMIGLMALPAATAVLGGFSWPVGAIGWFGTVAATACYILGFSSFFAAVQLLPPSQTGIMMNLEPLIATTAAMLVLGEPTYPEQWLGMGIIVVALAFSTLFAARQTAANG
ncbi:MAG: DMT family transporter, partial [Dongiaceae bacterium]